jgi:hypothetical protein
MPSYRSDPPPARPTRFKELGFCCHAPNLWRIMDITDDPRGAAVGPFYRSKDELLADLNRFAEDFGCEATKKDPRP